MAPGVSTQERCAPSLAVLGRSPQAEVLAAAERAANDPVVQALLRLYDGALLFLDRNLQAVGASASALKLLGRSRSSEILGQRLGEAIGCVHARDHAGGCGTSPTCATCGAATAMLDALRRSRPEEGECFLAVDRGDARDLNLRVRVSPMRTDPPLVLVALSDRAPERRRAALDHGLISDFAELVAALVGISDHLVPRLPAPLEEAGADLERLAARFAAELEIQRALANASLDTCQLAREAVPLHQMLGKLHGELLAQETARDKTLSVTARAGVRTLVANRPILERVLSCLVVNALEATPAGGEARLEVAESEGAVEFRVWNAGAVAPSAAPRIFQRYFTTKEGPARGHGTFLAKLLAERVLGGEVSFASSAHSGTTFQLRVPREGLPGRPPGASAGGDGDGSGRARRGT